MPGRTKYQAGDQTLLRQINLSAIMNNIRVDAPISRTVLADKTGLNKATITSLVNELIQRQFIKEVGLENSGLGRPSMQLTLNPDAGFILSCEIGVDFISVIGTDFSPKVIYLSEQSIDPSSSVSEVMDILLTHLKKAMTECTRKIGDNFLGLALGVPGLVDFSKGKLLFAPNLNWKEVPLKEILESEFHAPVFVDNEANLATLGEYYFGAAYQHDDVLYLSAGVGLGGGILRDGHLLRGVDGMAGEFGHITMDPNGELCGCGNHGCWETQVSQRALYRYVIQALTPGTKSVLSDLAQHDLSKLNVAMIVNAARNGDKVALDSLENVGRYLGIGIASCINALNPGIVVFGGIMSVAWEFLEPVIKQELGKRALYWNIAGTQVVLANHGNNACVMGGIATVYQAILSQPNGS